MRASTRLILTLSVTMNFSLWSRDVKQAFLQSEFPLDRKIFVKPPKLPNVMVMIYRPENSMLHALKPIYGLFESPGYWLQTFKEYQLEDLGMPQSILDPSLFFKRSNEKLVSLVGTLIDGTLACGNYEFSVLEAEKSAAFDVNPRESQQPFCFGGVSIMKFGNGLEIAQVAYSSSLKYIDVKTFTQTEFIHLLGQVAYVANTTRPDCVLKCYYGPNEGN